MQAHARLVENVERAYQRTPERGGKVDALRFTARKGIRRPVQGEVAQPYSNQIGQARTYLVEQPIGHLLIMRIEG